MRPIRLTCGLVLLALAGACDSPAAEPLAAPRTRSAPDKAALYGDPGLVPTREGERARSELALSGELLAALETMPELEARHVSVTLPADEARRPAVLVSATVSASDADTLLGLERRAVAMASTIVPGCAADDVTVAFSTSSSKARPGRPDRIPLPLPLAFAILGLGVSLGIAGERLRGRRAPA